MVKVNKESRDNGQESRDKRQKIPAGLLAIKFPEPSSMQSLSRQLDVLISAQFIKTRGTAT